MQQKVNMMKKENSESFLQFCFKTVRLDIFLGKYLHRNERFKEFWKIGIFVFTMSHRQS